MQIKREVSLREAIAIVRGFLDHLEAGAVSVGGHEVRAEDLVQVELEIEPGDDKLELEFEIKWRAPAIEPANVSALEAVDVGPVEVAPAGEPPREMVGG